MSFFFKLFVYFFFGDDQFYCIVFLVGVVYYIFDKFFYGFFEWSVVQNYCWVFIIEFYVVEFYIFYGQDVFVDFGVVCKCDCFYFFVGQYGVYQCFWDSQKVIGVFRNFCKLKNF